MKRKTKLRLFFVVFVILLGGMFIIFNENGVIRYWELKKEVEKLDSQIDSINAENRKLEQEIDSLARKIPAKIERTAREKYDMMRKGETKIEVIEK